MDGLGLRGSLPVLLEPGTAAVINFTGLRRGAMSLFNKVCVSRYPGK